MQFRNLLAFILFVVTGAATLILIIFTGIAFLVKDDFPHVLGYITVFVLGNFIGAFMSASSFYFGEPKTTVPLSKLLKTLGGEDTEQSAKENEDSAGQE